MRISDWSSDVCSSDLIRNGVDDCSKSGWVSIGHTARKAVILGALSRDHISGDRPGTASKTQKAGICRKSSFHESHGLINRLQLFLASHKRGKTCFLPGWCKPGTFSRSAPEILAQGRR